MGESIWELTEGDGPVVATAIHHGHEVRAEVASMLALSGAERLREEDPHTGAWTQLAATSIVVGRSRFEIDLNRPRAEAAYVKPDDA